MDELPPEIAILIYEFLPLTVDKLRLAQTCRVFAYACREPTVWSTLQLHSIGLILSLRTGRRITPSPIFFLESLFSFLSNRRFSKVKSIDALGCYLVEPSMFVSTLLLSCCPEIESIDVSDCEPDFSWSFLRLKTIPMDQASGLLKLPRLKSVRYGKYSWSVQTSPKGRLFIRN